MSETNTRNPTTELIDEFFKINREVKDETKALDDKKKKRNAIQLEIMERMDTDGVDLLRSDLGGTVFKIKPKVCVSFKKGMKEEAHAYLKSSMGLDDLFTQTVSMSTLGKIFEEKILEGFEPPEDLFGIYYDKKLGHRS